MAIKQIWHTEKLFIKLFGTYFNRFSVREGIGYTQQKCIFAEEAESV